MSERDYARITWWKNKTLGLMLINRKHRNFFLHAKTLIPMVEQPGILKLIKRRAEDPLAGGPLHPGDILGEFVKAEGVVQLDLYLGELERSIEIDKKTGGVDNILDHQTYILPAEEFDKLFQALTLMLVQEEVFNQQWQRSQSEVPASYFVDDEQKARRRALELKQLLKNLDKPL